MTTYRVRPDWGFRYREHTPGTVFEAELTEQEEARALALGTLIVLDRSAAAVQPGSVRLPSGRRDSVVTDRAAAREV